MPLLDHFGLLAPVYERFIHVKEPTQIIKYANLPVEGLLLDVGGGTGRITQTLKGYASGIIVADLSEKMLSQAQQKDSLLPVCSHSEKLPFADQIFDSVIMVDALHHVCDQQQTADELWRVVKPGGHIVVEEPDIQRFSVKLVALAEKLAFMRSHFLAPERIQGLFTNPQARIEIFSEGFNAWVVIQKT